MEEISITTELLETLLKQEKNSTKIMPNNYVIIDCKINNFTNPRSINLICIEGK